MFSQSLSEAGDAQVARLKVEICLHTRGLRVSGQAASPEQGSRSVHATRTGRDTALSPGG